MHPYDEKSAEQDKASENFTFIYGGTGLIKWDDKPSYPRL